MMQRLEVKRFLFVGVLFFTLLLCVVQPVLGANDNSAAMQADDIFKMVNPAVFSIETYDLYGNKLAAASGFIIDSTGKAVTNYHVIEDAYYVRAKLTDGRLVNVTKILYMNRSKDVAIIQLEGSNYSTVKLGDSENIITGQNIFVIGNPLGLENTISNGIVSSSKRVLHNNTFIQVTAPISHGSSGGVLLNTSGEVIGVTTMYIENGQNLNFAIPINDVKESLDKNDNAKTLQIYQKIKTQLIYDCESFTVNYPSDWIAVEMNSDVRVIFINADGSKSNVTIEVGDNPPGQSIQTSVNNLVEYLKSLTDNKLTVKLQDDKEIINGNTYYKINCIRVFDDGAVIQEIMLTNKENKIYLLTLTCSLQGMKDGQDMLKNMLATFSIKDTNQERVSISKKTMCKEIRNGKSAGETKEFTNKIDNIFCHIIFDKFMPNKVTARWYYLNNGMRQFITGLDKQTPDKDTYWFGLDNDLFINRPGIWECQIDTGNEIKSLFFMIKEDPAIGVRINKKYYTFPIMPVIDNGRLLVPFRGIGDALGATVEWDGALNKVTLKLEDKFVEFIIGEDTANTSNGKIKLDVPAKIINGYTVVPLRFIGESLGANVNWDGKNKVVTITTISE